MKNAVDLFCGAGGTTTGLLSAAAAMGQRVDLLAINHWSLAIDTHLKNHPDVRHLCESLDNVDPRKVSTGRLHILCASPECTHHSIARGGRPRSDQSRAGAWHVVRWAEAKQPDGILIENVREFRDWGPLRRDGKPMKRYKGRTFAAFLKAIESLGYTVEHRILNCADYGDPTTRQRLFIMARRKGRVIWPEASHAGRWRSAREIIDWSLKGKSIFGRKKPLSENTTRRIMAGFRKFGGEKFLIHLTHQGERPAHSIDMPLRTVTTARRGEMALVEPFLVHLRGTAPDQLDGSARSLDEPVPTLTTSGAHVALCQPFVIGQQSGAAPRSVSEPLPTVATAGAIALVEPFLVKYYGAGVARSVGEPLDTVTTRDRFGLVEPLPLGNGQALDFLFRMLQPHELAAAMGFPAGYQFAGNREDQVRQIGNAVPVRTAAALCRELLS